MAHYQFDYVGERLCLDFCNTVSGRGLPRRTDHLPDYRELVRWIGESGAIAPAESRRLLSAARARPAEARRVGAEARALRDAFFRVLLAALAERRGRREDLALVSRHVAAARARTALAPSPSGGYLLEPTIAGSLRGPLWRVALSMADLLTSDELGRVRRCEAWDQPGEARCAWVFLDATRNHSRRWCSMAECGNRMKARRHYQRVRSGGL